MPRVASALSALTIATAVTNASLVRFEIMNGDIAPGEVLTIDLVLDATDYAGPFDAWQFFEGVINITSTTTTLTPGLIVASADQPGATAPSDVDGDGVEEFGPFGGELWTSGRRPGAFPFSGFRNGGAQFSVIEYTNIVSIQDGLSLISPDGREPGFYQDSQTPNSNRNPHIHRGRVYHGFRLQLQLPDTPAELTLSSQDALVALYPVRDEAHAEFIFQTPEPLTISTMPSPASIATIALAAPIAFRRRRGLT